MNREMVTYSEGASAEKVREREDETEYEEWIYGEPPQDVEFFVSSAMKWSNWRP